ncbi:MAG: hypothetical protein V4636_13130 [Pseudomonadota bacterium]
MANLIVSADIDAFMGAANDAAARTELGLGTIATQAANNVALTGGTIDAVAIGASTPAAGRFASVETPIARLPHGAAPGAPVDGDMWTTTAGLFVRINGVTVGPIT